MNKPTTRLGRGLTSLVTPRSAAAGEEAERRPAIEVRMIPVDQIHPSPRQTRRTLNAASIASLAESIRAAGVLQPVLVRRTPDGSGYELVAGERRWRAAREAGLDRIPALIKEGSDVQAYEAALIENVQREDLNPIERAQAYRQYLELFGGTIEALAAKVGESRANVSNYLRLLELEPEIQKLVLDNQLSMGHARAIAGIQDRRRQLAVARLVVRRNLSVRQTEALVDGGEELADPGTASASDDGLFDGFKRHLAAVEQALGAALGLRVRVQADRGKKSGKVIILFSSPDEFERIAEKLCGRRRLE